ncbi:hypothetical protein AVEN_116075-1 [Araneus ventricosus]|uniref:Uncharacterized protein n=1 Tax=Araneus ventricosus TaxID=182803 RepID=A0A4Y2SC76_ARAVE|nr:hypothetical protein AVEN_116075-1 [Araneus ventricosus]
MGRLFSACKVRLDICELSTPSKFDTSKPKSAAKMTPMDFFLWGYLKQQVYATSQPTLRGLRRRVTDACASVTTNMLKCSTVLTNLTALGESNLAPHQNRN